MTKTNNYARTSALPAIAAALALSSTPLLAQQADPVPVDPPPLAVEPAQPTAPQPAATDASSAAAATDTNTNPGTSSARPGPVQTKAVTHAVSKTRAPQGTATRFAARTPSAHRSTLRPQPAQTAAVTSTAARSTSRSAVTPGVNLASRGVTPPTATPRAALRAKHDNTVPIAAGGVLALLAFGSAAVAMNRRRADEDEDEWTGENPIDETAAAGDHTLNHLSTEDAVREEQPAIVAPPLSAFRWENGESGNAIPADEPLVEKDDRQPGETWVERAYRGPSALNPSVSLKARLKRAAFFDKRERDAAAGLAEPVDPTAGLPDRLVDEDQETQFA